MSSDKRESQIRSTSVSLGMGSAESSRPKGPASSWNLLVCADLGFASAAAEKLTSAEWDEFLQSHRVEVRGTVPNRTGVGGQDFFVEYRLTSLRDLSAAAVAGAVPQVAAMSQAAARLGDVADGRLSVQDFLAWLTRSTVPAALSDRITRALQPAGQPNAPQPPSAAKRGKLDGILAMTALGEGEAKLSGSAADAFPFAVFADTSGTPTRESVLKIQKPIAAMVDAQVQEILAAPSIAETLASWLCLREIARIIGRKRDVSLSVYSAPADAMPEALEKVMGRFDDDECMPHVVLWGYPVRLSTAGVDLLTAAADVAGQHKAALLTSLASSEALTQALGVSSDLAPVFDDHVYLPLKRARKEGAARCVALCAPDVRLRQAEGMPPLAAGAAWYVAARWVDAVIAGKSPFMLDLALPSENLGALLPEPFAGATPVKESVAAEALEFGLTVLHARGPRRVNALIDAELVDHAYTHLGVNLLVNRIMRRCAMVIAGMPPSVDADELQSALQTQVQADLAGCGVLTRESDAVEVAVESDGGVAVRVQSDAVPTSEAVEVRFSAG